MTTIPDRTTLAEPLFDVVILNTATMTVTGFAEFCRKKEYAEASRERLSELLNPGLEPMLVDAGSVAKGDEIFLPSPENHVSEIRRLSVIEQRQADCQCIMCGSPNLSTRLHCEECAKIASQRSVASRVPQNYLRA